MSTKGHIDTGEAEDFSVEIDLEPLSDAAGSGKRRFPRYDEPGLSGRLPFRTTASVIDVSREGLGLMTQEALRRERDYTLTLLGGDTTWSLTGRTAWNRLTATTKTSSGDVQPLYRSGLRLAAGQDTSKQPGLKEFIGRNAISTRGNGPPTRFQLRDLGPMMLETEYHFDVRTLSLSGMLIETELIPEPESTVDMIMTLPATEVEVRGRVVDVLRGGTSDRSLAHVGIEFRALAAPDRNQIDRYIETELR